MLANRMTDQEKDHAMDAKCPPPCPRCGHTVRMLSNGYWACPGCNSSGLAKDIAFAPKVKELMDAGEDMHRAVAELMAELAGKRATDWGVVNDALVRHGRALKAMGEPERLAARGDA